MKTISVLSIPLHAHAKAEDYAKSWRNRNKEERDVLPSYRYNDIVGYVEFAIEGDRDILIYFHLKGIKYQNIGLARYRKDQIYKAPSLTQCGIHFERVDNPHIKRALRKALLYASRECKMQNMYFDFDHYSDMIKYFDFCKFLKSKG
jgi:hypothetical protein